MERQADFGGFLGMSFDLVSRNVREVVIFVLVIGGVTAAGQILGLADPSNAGVQFGMGFMVEADDSPASVAFEIGSAILSIVASYFLLAQYLASAGRLPDRQTRIWAYIGMSILSILGLIVGFFLLIVPGIILLVRWSAASGFLLGAREGVVEALSASWDATRGHSWPIFGAGLVLFLILAVAGFVIGAVAGVTGLVAAIALATGALEAIGNAFFLAFGIGVFLLVNDDTQDLAGTFE